MRPAIRTVMLFAFAALASLSVANQASAQEVRREAQLAGTTAASGKATFRQKGTTVQLSVEIEDATPSTAMRITIRRAGKVITVGSFTTSAVGFADLNRSGAGATPLLVGDTVVVQAGTRVVVSGVVRNR